MGPTTKIIKDLLLSRNLNKHRADLVKNLIKTKTVEKMYIKILKLKIK